MEGGWGRGRQRELDDLYLLTKVLHSRAAYVCSKKGRAFEELRGVMAARAVSEASYVQVSLSRRAQTFPNLDLSYDQKVM